MHQKSWTTNIFIDLISNSSVGFGIRYADERMPETPRSNPGPRLNIKTVFPRYGVSHVKDKTVLYLTWESLYWLDDIFILRQTPGLIRGRQRGSFRFLTNCVYIYVYMYIDSSLGASRHGLLTKQYVMQMSNGFATNDSRYKTRILWHNFSNLNFDDTISSSSHIINDIRLSGSVSFEFRSIGSIVMIWYVIRNCEKR